MSNNISQFWKWATSAALSNKQRVKGKYIPIGKRDFYRLIEDTQLDGDLFCYYCGFICSEHHEMDHKIPLARGGSNTIGNIVISCVDCNQDKWTMTDKEFLKSIGRTEPPIEPPQTKSPESKREVMLHEFM